MEQILSMLSKEVNDNIQIHNNSNKNSQFELLTYSDKTSEFYFVYQDKLNKYFLLTYFLLNQSLKSRIYLPIINQEINQIILHDINNENLCLLTTNSINIIKSLSEFTKENSSQSNKDTIYSLHFEKVQILQFNFSNYDNYFGVLLSNNTFVFDSIIQHSNNNINYLPLSKTKIISFNFIPLHHCGWGNFMLILMNSDGNFYLCGPLFPDQFTLDKEYILAMKENIAKKKQLSPSKITNDDLLNNFLFQNIQEGLKNSFKTTVLIKSSDFMKKYNTNLIIIELQLANINQKELEKLNFRQFFILDGFPITLIRISNNNTVDVLIITGEFSPIRKKTNRIMSTLYHIEHIDLLEKRVVSSKYRCIQISNETIIIIMMNNVYKIRISYLNQLKQLLDDNIQNENMIYQFESQVRQLRTNFGKDIRHNYYFCEKLYGELVLITYVNQQFIYDSIDLIDDEDDIIKLSKEEKDMIFTKSKSEQFKPKDNKNPDVNNCLINLKNINTKYINTNIKDSNIEEEDSLEKDFEQYFNDYKDTIPNIKDNLSVQIIHLLSRVNKSKELINILQFKYNNYLNSIETINELNKDISSKRKKINKKIDKLAKAICILTKQKGKANNTIIGNKMIQIKDQAIELSTSIESLKKHNKESKNNNLTFNKLPLPFKVDMRKVTFGNITNKNLFMNEIICLKQKIVQLENNMKYFNMEHQ